MCKQYVNGYVCIALAKTKYCPFAHIEQVREAYLISKGKYVTAEEIKMILTSDAPDEFEIIQR